MSTIGTSILISKKTTHIEIHKVIEVVLLSRSRATHPNPNPSTRPSITQFSIFFLLNFCESRCDAFGILFCRDGQQLSYCRATAKFSHCRETQWNRWLFPYRTFLLRIRHRANVPNIARVVSHSQIGELCERMRQLWKNICAIWVQNCFISKNFQLPEALRSLQINYEAKLFPNPLKMPSKVCTVCVCAFGRHKYLN